MSLTQVSNSAYGWHSVRHMARANEQQKEKQHKEKQKEKRQKQQKQQQEQQKEQKQKQKEQKQKKKQPSHKPHRCLAESQESTVRCRHSPTSTSHGHRFDSELSRLAAETGCEGGAQEGGGNVPVLDAIVQARAGLPHPSRRRRRPARRVQPTLPDETYPVHM